MQNITVEGLNDEITALLGGADTLTSELSKWCAAYYPTASTASWTGIATIDYNENTITTAFTLTIADTAPVPAPQPYPQPTTVRTAHTSSACDRRTQERTPMNNITITETSVYDRRRRWLRMAAITAVAIALVLLLPVTAHAEEPEYHWITDFGGSLRKFICSMILGWATSIFNVYNQLINHVGTEALLSGPFDSLLGTDMYNLTNNIFQTAVIPVGESILALFMLVQLVKISQRIDATSTLPAVKEIVFLAVIYVLLHWFINNSLDIMQAIYGIVNDDIIPTIGSVGDSTGEAGVFSLDGVTQDQWDSMNIGDCFMTLIMSVICLLFGLVAFVLGFAMCYVRAWQIYIYAAFSPIPISLLGFEETRQMGIGFLKNFASVCLAGAILLFLFVAYPFVLAGSVSSLSAGNDILFLMTTSSADSLINLLKGVAISVVLIFMIVKSGGIAKEILGS